MELGGELDFVLMIDGVGTRNEVGHGEPDKDETSPRPREESPTSPLYYLTEVIGRGDIVVETTLGEVVIGVARFAEMADNIV